MNNQTSFQVQFEIPLVSVSAMGALVVAENLTREALALDDVESGPDLAAEELVQTIQSIEAKLAAISETIQAQNQSVVAAATEYGLEIVRLLLQNDDELIEKRLLRYVEIGLAQNDPEAGEPQIYVHSECLEGLKTWMAAAGKLNLELHADDSILPGDCRIEVGETGLLASVESQLELIATKLRQAHLNKRGNA